MALPRLQQTWQFNTNQQVGSWSSTLAANQSAMYALKQSLRNFSSSPWAVWGSCNGRLSTPSFGNGDGIDYWLNQTNDVLWAASGNHSWIVLEQVGLGAHASICIDLLSASSWLATVVFSPSAGFGSAHGGTNGSAAARPQASDELVLLSAGAWGGYNGSYTWRLNVMQSANGACTRVAMFRNSNCCGFWLLDKAKNPVSTWDTPAVGVVLGASDTATSVATYANLSSAANVKGRMAGDACTYYLTYEAYGTTAIPSGRSSPDDDTGEWAIFPAGLLQAGSLRHRGRKGELYDFWWASDWTAGGDTYPEDGSNVLCQFTDVILPWDGSVPWNMV